MKTFSRLGNETVCMRPRLHSDWPFFKCSSLQGFQTDFSLSRKNKKKYQQIVAEKVAQAAGKKNKRRFHQKSTVKKQ